MKQLLTQFLIYGPLGVLYIASLLAASSSFLSHFVWHVGRAIYIPRKEWNAWPYKYKLPSPQWLVWMRENDSWTVLTVLASMCAPFLLAIWLALISWMDMKPTTPRRNLRLFTWTWMVSSVGWWLLVMWSPTGSP